MATERKAIFVSGFTEFKIIPNTPGDDSELQFSVLNGWTVANRTQKDIDIMRQTSNLAELNELLKNGWKVVSTSGGGGGGDRNFFASLVVLEKES